MSPAPFVSMKWGNAKHLTHALFDQGDIWVTATSEVRKIEDMAPSHVLNTLLMIERMDDLPIDNLHGTKLYQALYDRMLSFLPKEPAPDAPSVDSVWPYKPLTPTFVKRVAVDSEAIVLMLEEAIAHAADDTALTRRVWIDYTDANGITTTGRRIAPKELIRGAFSRNAMSLRAFDLDKSEPRNFLVDRIQRVEVC